MQILATEGHRALKLAPLCAKLGVTTGSFYNYFVSWDAFTPQLLAHWEKEQTFRIEEHANRSSNPVVRIFLLKELATELPHEAEMAIRSWSNGDPIVAEFQHRVDNERMAIIRSAIAALIPDPDAVALFGLIGLGLLTGVQSLRSPVDRDELHRVFDEFERMVLQRAGVLDSTATDPKASPGTIA